MAVRPFPHILKDICVKLRSIHIIILGFPKKHAQQSRVYQCGEGNFLKITVFPCEDGREKTENKAEWRGVCSWQTIKVTTNQRNPNEVA